MQITELPINCAHDKIVPIHEIVPNPRNPNLHSPEQVAWIAKVIQHRGWRAPVVVSTRSGFVVCGHGRVQAALQLGVEGVPVDFQDFESEADEWAHMVADNALAEMSAMAEDDLLELARDITDAGLDMDLAGLDAEQLVKEFQAQEDELPDLPDGDGPPIRTFSFKLTDAQLLEVENAIQAAKDAGPFGETQNENANANALVRICEAYTSG
jgi:hypothetical protein